MYPASEVSSRPRWRYARPGPHKLFGVVEDVGAQEGVGAPYAARLNYLAPDIVLAILNGRRPVGLTARKLMTDTGLPFAWAEQRVALGFIA